MLISWGSGEKTKDLKIIGKKFCKTCEMMRPFKLFLRYKFSYLFHLFQWVTEKQYMLVCEVCQQSMVLDAAEAESALGKNPIPLWTRYSWALLVGLVLLPITLATIERYKQEFFISAPQVNDIYVVDLVMLLKDSRFPGRYGKRGQRQLFSVRQSGSAGGVGEQPAGIGAEL